MKTSRIQIAVLCAILLTAAKAPKPTKFLRFTQRDHVELLKTKDMLDLNEDFTVELWTRWDTDEIEVPLYFMGDEAWPGMSESIPVDHPVGWVLRTGPIERGNRRNIEFNIAGAARGEVDWIRTITPAHRIPAQKWQHIAVTNTSGIIRIFWNGKLSAERKCRSYKFQAAPSEIYLGARDGAWKDREFVGDIRAVRIASKSLYTKDFKPAAVFKPDSSDLLRIDLSNSKEKVVSDISGKGHDGTIEGAKWVTSTWPAR